MLVLAHGAGAGQDHPWMVRWSEALAARGLGVVTFNFPYMERGRGAPDRMPALVACWRNVLEWARGQKARVAVGGKSMGGRAASMLVAEGEVVDALVLLGYPLHPPKQPEKLRVAHLPKVAARTLIVQGERDEFGTEAEMRPVVATMPAAELLVVKGGDHSLAVPKKLRPQAEVDAEVQDAIVAFLR
jgi:predicted alpha/beta-hydrolase family hydrolase